MYIEPFLLLSLVAITVMVGAALVVLLLSYDRATQELRRHERKGEQYATRLKLHARHIIERARAQSLSMLEEANSKAQEVLERAEVMSQDAKDVVRNRLEEVAKREKEAIHKTAEEMIGEYQEVMGEVGKDIAKKARLEASTIHKELEGKMQEEYGKLDKDVAAYKKEALAAVDASIYAILSDVAKRVIGKSLTFDDHQELVIKALEEAKKQGDIV